MYIKRMLMTAAASLLLSVVFVTPVSAHGHHYSKAAAVTDECPVCTIDDCTETGRHIHDDKYYCGYEHSSGYCDGSCEASCNTTAKSSTRRHHREHGCH